MLVWGPSTVLLGCTPCGGLCAAEWWRAFPGGVGLPPLRRASCVRRCPSPGRPSFGAGGQGSAILVSRARLMWAWGPNKGPKALTLASRCRALWGWLEGVPGGGASRDCEGRLSSGAVPQPGARPLGGLSGSVTHVPLARVCSSGGPALSLWVARPLGGCALRSRGGPSLGGIAFNRCEGGLVSGAVPPPAARLFRRAVRVPRFVYPGRGWCWHGVPAPVPHRAPWRAVVARCGGGGRAFLGRCLSPF